MSVGYVCTYCGNVAEPMNYHEGEADCRAAAPQAVPVTTWHGCYDDGWKGVITPEAESDGK